MKAWRTLTLMMLAAVVTAFGAAIAQEGSQDQMQQDQSRQNQAQADEQQARSDTVNTDSVDGVEYVPFGDVQVSDPEPAESENGTANGTENGTAQVQGDTGALIISGSTPEDQHPNFDLVGPNGFYEHFEVPQDEEWVFDDLLPGVYSVAATDDNLQLAHGLVEVVVGRSVRVDVNLAALAEDFEPGVITADPEATPTYPDDSFALRRQTVDQQFGQISVETDDEDARFVITGPDNYSREFTGEFTASDLQPGVYTVVGTAPGAQVVTSKLEVDVQTATVAVPRFVVSEIEGVDGDVAGGGAAGESDQQQDGQQQDQQEQQQDDQ